MKTRYIILLATFLALAVFLLTGCNTPHTEGSSETEEVISASDSSVEEISSSSDDFTASDSAEAAAKKPFVIQNQDDDWDISGLTDPAPAEQLSQYFLDHLSSDQYLLIECDDYYDIGEGESRYHVFIWAENIEPFQNLLDSYDGPWTPILFGEVPYSLNDLMKAEADMKAFLEEHPEITYEEMGTTRDIVYVDWVKDGYEELQQFVDGYPSPELFSITKYVPEEMWNPD